MLLSAPCFCVTAGAAAWWELWWCKSSYDKLASLGCLSLALSREPRLLLDALKVPFWPYRNWWSEGPQSQEHHQGRAEVAMVFLSLYKGVTPVKEQDCPTSSVQWHWAPSHLTVDCRAEKPHSPWLDSHYSVLWKDISVRAVGSLLSIPGWCRKLRFLACRFVLKSLWPWRW